jgi:hypothetical protein
MAMMRITKRQLKRIIKEELDHLIERGAEANTAVGRANAQSKGYQDGYEAGLINDDSNLPWDKYADGGYGDDYFSGFQDGLHAGGHGG